MASADRLIEVFTEANARSIGAERDYFLSEACRDEPELKEQVLSLLRAHEGAGDFLEHTQVIPPATVLTEKPGDKIGRYKLLQRIGEGGCGVVYMAEQEAPVRRRVAFKVIKLGMDTKQVVGRFEAEQQALALMDHPNIAKVFDAGATNTGRPFFVMELVRGIRITDYCDQNNLPTADRLSLFIQVCQAIQHAHQKGIIHRDIKPSNILVTVNDGVPVPKVIDFGIAKAIEQRLTDKTVFTAFEQFIGTPAYMSPEQAEMTSLDIDTRADIYSLGVLLYELLSGNTPFDAQTLVASGVAEIRRIICEQEPPKPSTRLNTLSDADQGTVAQHRHTDPPKLMHLLRGDLDWIVMKCLEKDRARRYETANGLAMDLQRHLDNEPVVARPPTNLYRFQKLVRRNKLAFAAVSAVTATLVLGLGLSTWRFSKEKQARQQASTEAAKSEQVSTFLKDMLKGVGPSVALGRDTTMLREILDQTAERIGNDLKGQPLVEAELRSTLGEVYREIGEYKKSEAMHRETLELRRKWLGREHPDVAASLDNLANALSRQGDDKRVEALNLGREALAMRTKLLGSDHEAVAISLNHVARYLMCRAQGHWTAACVTEAETLYREELALRRKLNGNEHPLVAVALSDLSNVLRQNEDKRPEAEAMNREALAIFRKCLGNDHPDIADSLGNLSNLLQSQGRLAEAEVVRRENLAMRRKLLGEEHPSVAGSLGFLGRILQDQGRLAEAEPLYRESLAMRRKLGVGDIPEVGYILDSLAEVLRAQGKLADAEVLCREELARRRKLLGNDHPDLRHVFHSLTDVLYEQGKLEEAEASAREELALSRELGNESPDVTHAIQHLANVLMREGKYAEAKTLYLEAVEHADALNLNGMAWTLATAPDPKLRDGPSAVTFAQKAVAATFRTNHMVLDTLAAAYAEIGQFTNAVSAQQEAIAFLQDERLKEDYASRLGLYQSGSPYRNYAALERQARLLHDQGKLAEAEAVYRELLPLRRKLPADDARLASALAGLTSTLLAAQKFAEAEPLARECLTIREKKLPDDWLTFNARSMLGGSLLGQKQYTEAEPLLVSAYEGMKRQEHKIPANAKLRVKESLQRIVQLYEATGQSEKAAEWNRKLAEFDKAETEKKTAAPKP